METLWETGVRLRSALWADTATYAGKLIITIFAVIAEFERALIRERTSSGPRTARNSLRASEKTKQSGQSWRSDSSTAP